MAKVVRWYTSEGKEIGWAHWCPACQETHVYAVDMPFHNNAKWSFNGNVEKPSFHPSMNITTGYRVSGLAPETKKYYEDRKLGSQCHYFVTDGNIAYCGDCTHELSGKTVPLPDYPKGDSHHGH